MQGLSAYAVKLGHFIRLKCLDKRVNALRRTAAQNHNAVID